ncbi:MAG: AraC family transcriptional regulator ligand-binding domain-containing protein [Polyangiaceae bacterium]|nr:AraC family transcriptional regulator ligand-binding domain-containing protein [Polyangiaceae bacterium]
MGSGEPYIIASITQGLILGGMRVGLDPRDMLKHAGLDVDVLEDGDALVHFERQIEVSRMLFMHQPKFNTCLRVGKHFVPRRYGVIGNMLQHGTTFQTGLGRLRQVSAFGYQFHRAAHIARAGRNADNGPNASDGRKTSALLGPIRDARDVTGVIRRARTATHRKAHQASSRVISTHTDWGSRRARRIFRRACQLRFARR